MLDPMKLGRKHPCAKKNKKRLIAYVLLTTRLSSGMKCFGPGYQNATQTGKVGDGEKKSDWNEAAD